VKGGHLICVQALVDAGADVRLKDHDGVPPLYNASTAEIARVLLDAGAATVDQGISATRNACQHPNRINILRLLLQRFPGSDCNTGEQIRPYLFYAAESGNLEAVGALLDSRPAGYINTRTTDGGTALHCCENPEVVRLLLERGADPRIVDRNGKSPLMVYSNAACVRLLLEAAPDMMRVKDDIGWTPLTFFSCFAHQHEALEELFRYCQERNKSVEVEVNNKDVNGDTALHLAMVGGKNLDTVKLLLEKGADALGMGFKGTTVLMKPLLPMDFIEEAYIYHTISWRQDYLSTSTDVDIRASECLKAILDWMLVHGGSTRTRSRSSRFIRKYLSCLTMTVDG
jgi:ankyrin repeat protein